MAVDDSLVKLDAAGDLSPSWPENPKTFGAGVRSVQQTSDAGYIVGGGTLIYRLDAAGNLDPSWPQNPVGAGGTIQSVQQTLDGGYVVGAGSLVIKLDAAGERDGSWPQHPKDLGELGTTRSVRQTSDGGYILGVDVDFVVKLDEIGSLDPAWPENPKSLNGNTLVLPTAVRQTSDGGYIVTGRVHHNSWDIYVAKLDAGGDSDPSWSENPRMLGGDLGDSGRSVQQTSDGGYIVAGDDEYVRQNPGGPQGGQRNGILIKLDESGGFDPAWPENPKSFRQLSVADSLMQTTDDGFVVAGSGHRIDVFVIKLAGDAEVHPFRRGDGNGDSSVNLTDAVHLLAVLFRGAEKEINCDQAYDYDSDQRLDITDPVFLHLVSFQK